MDDWTPERVVDRLQIQEILYRYCRAIDRIQMDILASVFHTDAGISRNGTPFPVADFIAEVAKRHPTVPKASHMVTSFLIDFTGPDSAFCESWCLAVEQRPNDGDPSQSTDHVVRVRYGDKFERRDGVWRIAERTFIVDHVMAVPTNSAHLLDFSDRLAARRDSEDHILKLRRAEMKN